MNILKCFDNITDFYHQINYDLKIVVRICTCYYRLLEVLQIHYKLFLKYVIKFYVYKAHRHNTFKYV